MTKPSVKRRYESPVREAAARTTRRRIRASATELFTRDGYTATSTKAIAANAGVSERTVFLVFPTKAALLGECIRVAVRGDERDTPMLARSRWQAILDAPPQQMLALVADASADLMSRTARLLATGESVGPEDRLLNEVRDRGRAATRSDMLAIAKAMKRTGLLRNGLSAKRAADVMYAIAASESVYLRLVEHQGWSDAAYARMLERALGGALT